MFEKETLRPDFWNDNESAQEIMREINTRRNNLDQWQSFYKRLKSIEEVLELTEKENDQQLLGDVHSEINALSKELDEIEFQAMLNDSDDHLNAILTIHPAGAIEV